MAILHESTQRAIGTFNNDFRISSRATGVLIIARISAKGAGAATLALALQTFDEASQTFIPIQDWTATQADVAIAAVAVAPVEYFTLTAYPAGPASAVTGTKKKGFTAAVPTGLRLVETVAVDTVTLSVSAKSLF
jgi:hypothetical protein